ncbi:MAG: amino acid adenylation domain-containing protein [Undibacterium sp.]|nr:amino acid adenylation domain-containing protein [Undibacterium sp.]
MNNFLKFLQFCGEHFIHFSLEEEQVKVHAPKGVLTAEVVTQLRIFKPELLKWLLAKRDGTKGEILEPIHPSDRNFPLMLSHGQEALWLTESMNNTGDAYHFVRVLAFEGALDVLALQESFSVILARHEALRTVFVHERGELFQKILPAQTIALDIIELDKPELISVSQQAFAAARFDLATDVMLRLQLIRLNQQQHQLTLVLHHIASDGWSLGVLVQEFQKLYTCLVEKQNPSLTPLSIQYADYAQWTRSEQHAARLQDSLEFWRAELADAPELHTLRTDHLRPAQQNFKGDVHHSVIAKVQLQALKQLAQESRATLFMALEILFANLLSRYSLSKDILFGSAVAGREHEEVAGLIGYFVNLVVQRHRLDHHLSYKECLSLNKKNHLATRVHQQFPFELLVRELSKTRSNSYSPIVQIIFSLQNNDTPLLALPGIQCTVRTEPKTHTPFDLELNVSETEDGLALEWSYASALFEPSSIQSMARHFDQLLQQVLDNPDSAMGSHDLMSVQERSQVQYTWNDTATAFRPECCVHELFEEHARKQPEAIALIYQEQQLSYGELNVKANQLAHYLIEKRQIRPDSLIGVCLTRSIDVVVAILGILKAGAAYLPLDPDYPVARLAYMLDDAKLCTVITQTALREKISLSEEQVLCLDQIAMQQILQAQSTSNIDRAQLGLQATHLAYVIYTSGSTGQPKASLLSHVGLCNLALAQIAGFDLSCHSRVLQFASIAFDAATSELFTALSSGASLVLLTNEAAKSPDLMSAIVERHQVTQVTLPPVLLPLLRIEQWESVTTLVVAGEACQKSSAQLWSRGRRFINAYGPSEATVCATMGTYEPEQTRLHIGKPLPNVQVYVLTEELTLAAIGIPGELHIGGVGLARAYLHRPELTEEKFINNPFYDSADASSSARLYKTGDLVRWLEDGNLEFLERIDTQIKLRGFRIELGEIENALISHTDVTEAVVVLGALTKNEQGLIAYVVNPALNEHPEGATLDEKKSESIKALRSFLSSRLPDYMLPSAFVFLRALPFNSSGKVDRKALPEADFDLNREAYTAPRNEMEKTVCELFQSILGIERVGINDNFFQLGGHSLLVMQVISGLQEKTISVTAAQVFAAATVEELALVLTQNAHLIEVAFVAPENRIPVGCNKITPDMLTMVNLSDLEIAHVIAQVEGGVANVQDIYPLAPMQEGILFHSMMSEHTDPSIISTLFKISGKAQLDAFLQAFQFMIDRYDVFRTLVLWEGLPVPVQVVCRQAILPITWLELDADQDAFTTMRELCFTEAQRMNLQQPPLLKLVIAHELKTDAYFVQLLLHHFVADHTSLDFILKEMEVFYLGQAASLPTPILYRNFVAHALHQAQNNDADAFFRRSLSEVEETTALFNLLNVQGDGSNMVEARGHLPDEVGTNLRRIAKELALSPASLLHTAWALVVSDCRGREELVFGTVMSGRLQGTVGAGSILGPMINILPLYIKLKTVTVLDLVHQTQSALRELLPYEQASLALAQRCSSLPEGAPLFTSLFNFRHSKTIDQQSIIPDMQLEFLFGYERTNYPVYCAIDDEGDAFAMDLQIDPSVDPQRVLAYMQTAVKELLHALEHTPAALASTISILPPEERHRLLVEWNDTTVAYPRELCIHELFEQQVAFNPDAIALTYEGQQLSYGELNAKANQLAHYLVTHRQVKPDSLVGICLERSLEMIIGIFGTLKAGAAYVPLDPDYPRARLEHMLKDAGLQLVLTHSSLRGKTPVTEAQAMWLDQEHVVAQLQSLPTSNIARAQLGVTPEHLAYVIYTSGSTGNPKGVMLCHSGLVNLSKALQKRHQLNNSDVVLQFAPMSFDMSVEEIFTTLSCGAHLVIRSLDWIDSTTKFWHSCAVNGVTFLNLPTAYWHELARADDAVIAPSVRHIGIGGEQVSQSAVDAWYQKPVKLPSLLNGYGPTECTVDATFAELKSVNDEGIGRPLDNTYLFILSENRSLLPIGAEGELYIGGAGLARGYHNRPDLTEEKFVPNPFFEPSNPASSERLYRTGDLVKYLNNGNVEFLGRIDQQVKIRGFRMELGEIENALTSHALVANAVVQVSGTVTSDPSLVAYVVIEGEHEGSGNTSDPTALIQTLRVYLAETLPDYMVPSVFMLLDRLPMMPNGKIDRKALPAPTQQQLHTEYTAPRNETEQVLCELWQGILGIERVSVEDNFFHLGGHSLSATRLLAQINQRFQVELTLRALFSCKTLENMALAVSQLGNKTLQVPPILATTEHSGMPSFSQQRLWLLDQIDGGSTHYHLSSSFKLVGDLQYDVFNRVLTTIIGRHESLRTCFRMDDGGQLLQFVLPAQDFLVGVTDLSHLPKGEQQLRLLESMTDIDGRAFDLGADLMLRAHLLQLAEEEYIVHITMHHIASDGWSMAILVNEFCALYDAYIHQRENPLPKLAIQYADYADWQRNWLQGEALETQLGYWIKQLSDLPVAHSLPLDHARPELQSFVGATLKTRLNPEVSAALKALCNRFSASLFMGVHAAFSVLLARYSNERDIVIGSPIANREQVEVASLIGFFVNTLVLRHDLTGDPSFIQLLEQSRSMLLDAYAHQQTPFEKIVERLQPQRSMSHTPLFQIMLVLQNNEEGVIELPGLTLSELEAIDSSAQFDLTLSVRESQSGILLEWEYNTDLFETSTISAMAAHFSVLFSSLVEQPTQSVFQAEMLMESEITQLKNWNSAHVAYPTNLCIHELFEAQAQRQPDAIALIFDDQKLSYAELNARANQLAHYLLEERQVKPDSLVGLCVERSLDMVIAMLGILKSGAAYVPLDPEYPPARLAYMLDDAGVTTVITQTHVRDRVLISDHLAVCLDQVELQQTVQSQAQHNIDRSTLGLHESHLAYVIYTSGSTGNPKGVMIAHASVVNLIFAVKERYKLSSEDGLLQFSTINFDMSVEDIFSALASGCRLILRSDAWLQSPSHFWQCCAANNASVLDLPTAYWHELVNELSSDERSQIPSCVRHISIGGEQVNPAAISEWVKHPQAKNIDLINVYGPTECTVDATFADITDSNCGIGKALPNVQLYVLNGQLGLCPIGVPGELHIGGAGLARGYLNRPDLTAEKFIDNPFYDAQDVTSSRRLYRTADLVVWRSDGVLNYLGRIDEQVKIRGFRIELGDVQAALQSHQGVKDALVTLFDRAESKSLAAYVVRNISQFPVNVEADEVFTVQDRKDLLPPGLFSYAYDVVLETERIALLSLAKVLTIADAEQRLYTVYPLSTLAYTRSEFDAFHRDVWPAYFAGAPILNANWEKMYRYFPQSQIVIKEAFDITTGIGNSVLMSWDGTQEDLPKGWDGALQRSVEEHEALIQPNTLVIMAGVIDSQFKERKIAGLIVDAFKALSHSLHLTHLIVALRPIAKIAHQAMSIEAYSQCQNEDKQLYDGWLRLHCSTGGKIIGWESQSQYVEASIAEWQEWGACSFEQSGEYYLENTLAAVHVDMVTQRAHYYDPCIWIEHVLLKDSVLEPTLNFSEISKLYREHVGLLPSRLVIVDSDAFEKNEGSEIEHFKAIFSVLNRFSSELLNAADLRNYLKNILPDYMIPSYFTWLESFPLTANGKLDRRALPEPNMKQYGYVEPQTEMEILLCELWQEVLDVEKVGVSDNFFQLGGHSLSATRMVSKLNKILQTTIALRTLFECKDLLAMATIVEEILALEKNQILRESKENNVEMDW